MTSDEALRQMPGPCVICGGTDYNLSAGGPSICPKCDCGHFDAATVVAQSKVISAMRQVLEAYEQLEADLILENTCWEGREVPQFTNELWERAIEIQAMRNKALGRFS